jgi:hypothetical protein
LDKRNDRANIRPKTTDHISSSSCFSLILHLGLVVVPDSTSILNRSNTHNTLVPTLFHSLIESTTVQPYSFRLSLSTSNLHTFLLDFDFPGGNNIDRLEPEQHRSNIAEFHSPCQIEISNNGFSLHLHPQRSRPGSGSQGYDRSYRPLVSPLNRFSKNKEQSSRRTLTHCLLTSFRLNPPLATANNDFSYLL